MKFILNWVFGTAALAACLAGNARAGVASAADGAFPRATIDRACVSAEIERAELVMGTVARIALPAELARPERFEAAFAALRDADRVLSLYHAESELVRVNAHAARHAEPVGAMLFAVLARARELSAESDGAFDVTILPLLRAWGAYPELSYLGAGNVVAIGFAGLRLDPAQRTVTFARPGMGVDLGGIAKGYALDRARAALVDAGVDCARLDLGGDLAFIGGGADGGWRVAVRDPECPEGSLGTLDVDADASVSTSGNYARDFAREGWRAGSHIYDPRTGRPLGRDLAVTVWSPDATTADALSTALIVLGPEEAAPLLAREPGVGALFSEGRGAARRLTVIGRPPRAWTPESPATALAAR